MGGNAVNDKSEAVAGRHAEPGTDIDLRCLHGSPDMRPVNRIGSIDRSFPNRPLGTAGSLFRGLKKQADSTLQFVPHFIEDLCRSQLHGNMAVMSAGMHNAVMSGKGQSGLFLYIQRIDICPEDKGFSRQFPVDLSSQSGMISEQLRLDPHRLKVSRDGFCRLIFFSGQFRMSMVITPSFNDVWLDLFCTFKNVHDPPPPCGHVQHRITATVQHTCRGTSDSNPSLH